MVPGKRFRSWFMTYYSWASCTSILTATACRTGVGAQKTLSEDRASEGTSRTPCPKQVSFMTKYDNLSRHRQLVRTEWLHSSVAQLRRTAPQLLGLLRVWPNVVGPSFVNIPPELFALIDTPWSLVPSPVPDEGTLEAVGHRAEAYSFPLASP